MGKKIKLDRIVKAPGHKLAKELQTFFREHGIFVVNLIGSPGSGKTSLLEALAPLLGNRAAVIEGDLATDEDARRLNKLGLRSFQINTVDACHLDPGMIRDALQNMQLDGVELLFIENVGNLVCPASFNIGEDMKVAVVSVTEGDDKPAKYPTAIEVSSAMVVTKIDLLPYLKCDVERMKRDARAHRPDIQCFIVSAQTGEGVREYLAWMEEQAEGALQHQE
ncbi:MAG TPA: hydrogenase nickel incorporation protein HypB [Candidatus Brocadiia bacterium]|nr:hydrogenase nickel incorporation protein HypB [Candidatus Brocadiia bacterium]